MAETGAEIKLYAPAKVNLTLEVLGKRADGYHELRSLVQCISLADELTLRPTAEGITVSVYDEWAPAGPQNLCYTAATIFFEEVGSPGGVEIQLTKHIPAGRGLGGGSSDAAATLLGLGELVEEPPSRQQLHEMAAELGSDVPLFLSGGTAVISGRGEQVHSVAARWRDRALVVAWPDLAICTTEAYELLERDDFTNGEITAAARQALAEGQLDAERHLFNCFQRAVSSRWPRIAELQEDMTRASGAPAALSGSGSAVFCILPSIAEAEQIAAAVGQAGYQAVAARPVEHGARLVES